MLFLVPLQIVAQQTASIKNIGNMGVLVEITHVHKDLFNSQPVAQCLLAYPEIRLIAPAQKIDSLKLLAEFKKIETQIYAAEKLPESYELSRIGVRLTATHVTSGLAEGHSQICNFAYIMEAGSSRILHTGDANADATYFSHPFFKKEFSAAIIPVWFAGRRSISFLKNNLKA